MSKATTEFLYWETGIFGMFDGIVLPLAARDVHSAASIIASVGLLALTISMWMIHGIALCSLQEWHE